MFTFTPSPSVFVLPQPFQPSFHTFAPEDASSSDVPLYPKPSFQALEAAYPDRTFTAQVFCSDLVLTATTWLHWAHRSSTVA